MEKKLYRSRTDRKIFGVCGGFAEYLECDSTLLRLGAVILSLAAGCGIILYLAAALIIPNEP